MDRRAFLLVAAGAPRRAARRRGAAGGQGQRSAISHARAETPLALVTFRQALQELGWVEGDNLVIELASPMGGRRYRAPSRGTGPRSRSM